MPDRVEPGRDSQSNDRVDNFREFVEKELLQSMERTKTQSAPPKLPDAFPIFDINLERTSLTNPALPASLGEINRNKVKLEDGTYERDDKGRVTSIVSADGKLKRDFKYDDPRNPNRITTEVINDKTFVKYLGPCTSNGRPVKQDGFEVNSYTLYDAKGNITGNWAGIRSVSPNGVFSTLESGKLAPVKHLGASGNELTEAQRKERENIGVWPDRIEATNSNGTHYVATLQGKRLEHFAEIRKVDGKEVLTNWKRADGQWVSDENPPRAVKSIELQRDGSLKYEELDGTQRLQFKDMSHWATKDGVTRKFDPQDNLTHIVQKDGSTRSFTYKDGKVVGITDSSARRTSTLTRVGEDEWQSGDEKQIRKQLKVSEDGSVEYRLANGNRVRENCELARIEYDQKDRPATIDFPSGSKREFQYKDEKLQAIKDTIASKDQTLTRQWTRQGDTNEFTQEVAGKTRTRIIDGLPNEEGDYSYLSVQPGKTERQQHTAKSRDVERQARGEIISSSEAVQEARVELLAACQQHDINSARFEGYLDDFERNATKYGLKPEQMTKAYENLRQILISKDQSPHFTNAQRKNIVETAMHNIARPMEIDQGYHPTCNVTTLEVYAAARHPDEYTRMCKEVALTGKYVTAEGETVTPPKAALMPGDDETKYDLDQPNVDRRNHASQIVQMTLVNGTYETGGIVDREGNKLTDRRYIMDKIEWVRQRDGSDLKRGEDRLITLDGKQVSGVNESDGPNFTHDGIMNASKMMLGYEMPYVSPPTSIDNGRTWNFELPKADHLLKVKQEGKLPIGVHTVAGRHVQTIHDVKMDGRGQCWVLLDNQHGAKKDGWVTLDDLHYTQKTAAPELEPAKRPSERP